MHASFRPPDADESPDRYLVLAPDTPEERDFCRALMAFFHDHNM
jgi:hypothetical protein